MPRLTRETIVAAAFELVDREGVAAASMRRLGAVLGCDASATYRYFPTKDALLDAVSDALLSQAVLPAPVDDPFDDLAAVAATVRRAALEHPRTAPLLAARPPLGPAARVIVERTLDDLSRAGLGQQDAARALQLLVTYTLGTLGTLGDQTRLDALRAQRRLADVRGALGEEGVAHPRTAQTLPFLDDNHDPGQFEFGLRVVLAGLRTLAAGQGPRRRGV